jgi:hypothetical protein
MNFEDELATSWLWAAGRGRPPEAAARRAGLEDVVEKVLTTSILKANRTALRAVKRQTIVAP